MSLPLSRPSLRRQDLDQVLEALVHDRLAGGALNSQLNKELTKAWGLAEGEVLASAADAVRRCFQGLGLAPGARVILTPLAPPWWLAGLRGLGLEPVWADVVAESPVVSAASVAGLGAAEALVVDGALGAVADLEALAKLGIPLIEDLTENLGGLRSGRRVGTWGQAVVTVFQAHTLVAGAGGAFCGFRRSPSTPPSPAWSLLSDLGSALVLSQWKDAEALAEKKREHRHHLYHRLPRHYRLLQQEGDAETVPPWLAVLVDQGASEVLAYTRKRGVEADWAFRANTESIGDEAWEACPEARRLRWRTLVFPLYSTFSVKELDLLAKILSSLP